MKRTANLHGVGGRYWIDQLNPWVMRFGDGWGIRWYGLAYLAGFLVAGWVLLRWARERRLSIPPEELPGFVLYAALGVMIGGRLGYCLFYSGPYVLHHPLEIIELWHGGMASHGGVVGLILAVWLFARKRHVSVAPLLDAAAATAPLGVAFGRIANFINGELWGRPSTVPWAVIFPQAPLVNGIEVPRHPSQLYAAGIEGLLVFLIAQWIYARTSRAGLTTAAVCITYGIGRFVDEFWRQPDLGQPVYWNWMSKGQLLTLPMIAIGLIALLWLKRPAPAPPTAATFPASGADQ
ncbi:MAG TPA: prolipoprotein diacylglyceryl transferase [Acidobacteriaceae bacterium]|jgi:phosphatidylglycerol:prolipoprotein diacylglycerol transferase|nr:prolipoprotein diacylglyceryl transferase [Acidobacteriaceae bacterium]